MKKKSNLDNNQKKSIKDFCQVTNASSKQGEKWLVRHKWKYNLGI